MTLSIDGKAYLNLNAQDFTAVFRVSMVSPPKKRGEVVLG